MDSTEKTNIANTSFSEAASNYESHTDNNHKHKTTSSCTPVVPYKCKRCPGTFTKTELALHYNEYHPGQNEEMQRQINISERNLASGYNLRRSNRTNDKATCDNDLHVCTPINGHSVKRRKSNGNGHPVAVAAASACVQRTSNEVVMIPHKRKRSVPKQTSQFLSICAGEPEEEEERIKKVPQHLPVANSSIACDEQRDLGDKQLRELATKIPAEKLGMLATFLGFSEAKLSHIRADNTTSAERIYQVLLQWRNQLSLDEQRNVSGGKLINTLAACGIPVKNTVSTSVFAGVQASYERPIQYHQRPCLLPRTTTSNTVDLEGSDWGKLRGGSALPIPQDVGFQSRELQSPQQYNREYPVESNVPSLLQDESQNGLVCSHSPKMEVLNHDNEYHVKGDNVDVRGGLIKVSDVQHVHIHAGGDMANSTCVVKREGDSVQLKLQESQSSTGKMSPESTKVSTDVVPTLEIPPVAFNDLCWKVGEGLTTKQFQRLKRHFQQDGVPGIPWKHIKDINDPQDFIDVLRELKYISRLNVCLLQCSLYIVGNQALYKEVWQYARENLVSTGLYVHGPSEIPEGAEAAIVKLKVTGDISKFGYVNVQQFQQHLARFGHGKVAYYSVIGVEEGCVTLFFQVPSVWKLGINQSRQQELNKWCMENGIFQLCLDEEEIVKLPKGEDILSPNVAESGKMILNVVENNIDEIQKQPSFHGVDVKIGGKSLVHLAVESKLKDVVEYLISHGARIDEVDQMGATPLHMAVFLKHSSISQMLLKHPDVDVNAVDMYGNTALHIATIQRDFPLCELLIQCGASTDIKNQDGKSPVDLAKEINFTSLLLLTGDAKVESLTVAVGETTFKCPICWHSFKEPRILPCGHNFCTNCLATLWKAGAHKSGYICCPACRQKIDVPNGDINELTFNLPLHQEIAEARHIQKWQKQIASKDPSICSPDLDDDSCTSGDSSSEIIRKEVQEEAMEAKEPEDSVPLGSAREVITKDVSHAPVKIVETLRSNVLPLTKITRKSLVCHMCHSRYKIPIRKLHCSHSFCGGCLETIAKTCKSLQCTICDEETLISASGGSDLIHDRNLESQVDDADKHDEQVGHMAGMINFNDGIVEEAREDWNLPKPDPESKFCTGCWNIARKSIYLPCGHECCDNCVERIQKNGDDWQIICSSCKRECSSDDVLDEEESKQMKEGPEDTKLPSNISQGFISASPGMSSREDWNLPESGPESYLCSGCWNIARKPIYLPCGHVCCDNCVDRIQKNEDWQIICSSCKRECSSDDVLDEEESKQMKEGPEDTKLPSNISQGYISASPGMSSNPGSAQPLPSSGISSDPGYISASPGMSSNPGSAQPLPSVPSPAESHGTSSDQEKIQVSMPKQASQSKSREETSVFKIAYTYRIKTQVNECVSNSIAASNRSALQHASGGSALPESHELRVQVHYRDNLKIDQTIRSRKGGIIFYKSVKDDIDVSGVEMIDLPLLDTNVIPGVTTPEQIKFTNSKVVVFSENGVRLYADQSGVYATRHCRSKVHFWSTECGDTEMVEAQPLPRDTPQMIFNYENFKQKLRNYLQAERGETVPVPWYPAVVLTFAQKWAIRSPLNAVLVSAIVTPLRAAGLLDELFTSWKEDRKLNIRRVNMGFHADLFEVPSTKITNTLDVVGRNTGRHLNKECLNTVNNWLRQFQQNVNIKSQQQEEKLVEDQQCSPDQSVTDGSPQAPDLAQQVPAQSTGSPQHVLDNAPQLELQLMQEKVVETIQQDGVLYSLGGPSSSGKVYYSLGGPPSDVVYFPPGEPPSAESEVSESSSVSAPSPGFVTDMSVTTLGEVSSPASQSDTTLYLAAANNQPDFVKYLIANGADPTIPADRSGNTPLHHAAEQGYVQVIEAILKSYGGRLGQIPKGFADAKNFDGKSPLHIAVESHGRIRLDHTGKIDSLQTIKMLMKYGASAMCQDNKSGKTALHYAVEMHKIDVTRLLLDLCNNAEELVNCQMYNGNTALHLIVGRREVQIEEIFRVVSLLMKYGANVSIENAEKDTPVRLVQNGNVAIKKFLAGQYH